jgi:hypothetical protein
MKNYVVSWKDVSPEVKRMMPDVAHHAIEPHVEKHTRLALRHLQMAIDASIAGIKAGITGGWTPEDVGHMAAQSVHAVNEYQAHFTDSYLPLITDATEYVN